MSMELVTGASQLRLMSIDAQRSEELRTGIAGKLVQVTTKGRGALVICNISDWRPRGNNTKALIEGGKLAQKRLEGRVA